MSNKLFILILASIIAIVIISFLRKYSQNIYEPKIIKVTEQIKVVEKDVAETRRIRDSFNLVNSKLERINVIALNDLRKLQLKSKELELKIITDTIYATVNDYIDNSNQRDEACNKVVSNLQKQLVNRNALIDQKDIAYKKQLANLDTAFSQQRKLESYIKNIKPRNQVYAGISANVYPVLGYGVDLGIKFKSGFIIEGRALQMNNNNYGQISIKKVLSFK